MWICASADGSADMNIAAYRSPLGVLTLAEENGSLVGLWMENQKYFPQNLPAPGTDTPVLCQAKAWLDRYFAGEHPRIAELPLAPQGSPFRREVWDILCRIPEGSTTTYAAIARELAQRRGIPRMSAQAVGGAVGHNPISIIIPCHRVLATDGSLTGYAGGVERKQWLLEFEALTVVSIQ